MSSFGSFVSFNLRDPVLPQCKWVPRSFICLCKVACYFLIFFVFSTFLIPCPCICTVYLLSSPLCASCNVRWSLWKMGQIRKDFLSIWPQRALHLPLTAWSIKQKCFLLLFSSWLLAHGTTFFSLRPPHFCCVPHSAGIMPIYLHFSVCLLYYTKY